MSTAPRRYVASRFIFFLPLKFEGTRCKREAYALSLTSPLIVQGLIIFHHLIDDGIANLETVEMFQEFLGNCELASQRGKSVALTLGIDLTEDY